MNKQVIVCKSAAEMLATLREINTIELESFITGGLGAYSTDIFSLCEREGYNGAVGLVVTDGAYNGFCHVPIM